MAGGQYRVQGVSGGQVRQSAYVGPVGRAEHNLRAGGLVLTGVVLVVYAPKDESPLPPAGVPRPVAVYCDVLVYSSRPELCGSILNNVPVAQTTGLHAGHVWLPRATTLDVTGRPIGEAGCDPRNLDGDHVLIQFLDDSLLRPIIMGRITHPQAGLGNDDLLAGHRERLAVADGNPSLWKHNGTFHGIDDKGNFVVDGSRAHDGQYTNEGQEQPVEDGAHGNAFVTLHNKASLDVVGVDKDAASEKFHLVLKDGAFSVVMGADATKELSLDTAGANFDVKLGSDNKTIHLDAATFLARVGANNKNLILDGAGTKFSVNLGANQSLVVDASGTGSMTLTLLGTSFKVEQSSALTVVTVGDGSDNAVAWTPLNTLWSTIMGLIASHVHPTTAPGNVTLVAPALATIATAPPLSLAKSNHLKIPLG
jgi:hypothetical protein